MSLNNSPKRQIMNDDDESKMYSPNLILNTSPVRLGMSPVAFEPVEQTYIPPSSPKRKPKLFNPSKTRTVRLVAFEPVEQTYIPPSSPKRKSPKLFNPLKTRTEVLDPKVKEIIDINIDIFKETGNLLSGPLNYFMSRQEVKYAIQRELEAFKADGKIISADEFELVKDQYYNKRLDTFDRIYGAKYINELYKNKKTPFKAPDFIIVLKDPTQPTQITVSTYSSSIVSYMLKNNEDGIYFKNIIGECCARHYSYMLSEIGYTDVQTDNCNVIEDATGQPYIVDTEIKSFTDFSSSRILDYFIGYKECEQIIRNNTEMIYRTYNPTREIQYNVDIQI